MQALAHRSGALPANRVQGSRKVPAVVCLPSARPQQQQQPRCSVAPRAASDAFDLSEFAEDLDVNVSAGAAAPLATENGG